VSSPALELGCGCERKHEHERLAACAFDGVAALVEPAAFLNGAVSGKPRWMLIAGGDQRGAYL